MRSSTRVGARDLRLGERPGVGGLAELVAELRIDRRRRGDRRSLRQRAGGRQARQRRFAELVVGVPDESVGAIAGAGVAHVITGAAAGLTGTGSQLWSQNSAGIADSAETGDGFGASLGA